MDINEVRRFMKALHDLEGFEAISVWYDNFLQAGRIFSDEIKESIGKSDAFALLVTPNVLQKNDEGKDNYVVAEEYPFARAQGKPIAPIEALPTDHTRFAELFAGADKPVALTDHAAVRAAFAVKLPASAYQWAMASERAYLLGMAYLKGFGLERDVERAIGLLENAVEAGGESAYDAAWQLAEMYQNGIGVGISYDKALSWRTKAATLSEQVYGLEHPNTARSYNNMANVYNNQGDYAQALAWHGKALAIKEKVLGKEHPDTAVSYHNMANVYYAQGDYAQALAWHEKALAIREKVLGKEHPDTAASYDNMANVYYMQGNYAQALAWYEKALVIREKVFGKEHPDTAASYNNMANVYYMQGNYAQALAWYEKALAIWEKVLGKEHPNTVTAYNNIALVQNKLKESPNSEPSKPGWFARLFKGKK